MGQKSVEAVKIAPCMCELSDPKIKKSPTYCDFDYISYAVSYGVSYAVSYALGPIKHFQDFKTANFRL